MPCQRGGQGLRGEGGAGVGHLPTWLGKGNGWGVVGLGPYLPGGGGGRGAVTGPLDRGAGGSLTYQVSGEGVGAALSLNRIKFSYIS